MPLLKGQPYVPDTDLPPGLKAEELVYIVRATGEVVRTYDEYLEKLRQYCARQWGPINSTRQDLTYSQALKIEVDMVAELPSSVVEKLLSIVHHSTGTLEELVDRLAHAQDEQGGGAKMKKRAVSKEVLRRFVQENAEHRAGAVWIVHEGLREKYNLPLELPPSVREAMTQSVKSRKQREASQKKTSVKSGASVTVARSLEEEKQRLKEGTIKYVAFKLMEEAGPEGMSIDDIYRLANERNMKTDWTANGKKILMGVIWRDPTFCRVSRGRYSIRSMEGVVPQDDPAVDKDVEKQEKGDQPGAQASEQAANVPAKKAKHERRHVSDLVELADQAEKADDDDGMYSLARSERTLEMAETSLQERQGEVLKLEKAITDTEARIDELQATLKTPAKRRSLGEATGTPPALELPPELQEYTGAPGDRKALMAWKKKRADTEKELEAARERQLQESRSRQQQMRAEVNKEVTKEQKQLDKLQENLEAANRQLGQAVKAQADAKKAYDREVQKQQLKDLREKEKQEREKQKLLEKEERERRKQEALEAKKYPIDDLELLQELMEKAEQQGESQPPSDVSPPLVTLEQSEANRLADLLYVSDLLTQFAKVLDTPALSYQELEEALEGISNGEREVMGEEPHNIVAGVYVNLLAAVLDDVQDAGAAGRLEKRWQAALEQEGTWPEVLRRYVVSRAGVAARVQEVLVNNEALVAASNLAFNEVETLTFEQHLALLIFLCDEVMDTETMRNNLNKRMEEAGDVAASIKAELAEDKKKLKELKDAEKEERKRKRQEMLAQAQAAAERTLQEIDAQTNTEPTSGEGGLPTGAEDLPGAKKQKLIKELMASMKEGADSDEEEEPLWELPEELQEYRGDPDDRKAQLQFRQHQQVAKQKLEKDKARWMAEQRRKQKERAAAKKAALEEEKRKEKLKKEAEDAIIARQEALEKELDKFIIRRGPLGYDRHYRKYWWGLGGYKAGLLVEDLAGQWSRYSSLTEVDDLVQSLDVRGVREKDLRGALDKVYASLANALKRVEKAKEKDKGPGAETKKEKESRNGVRVQPSRAVRQQSAGAPPSPPVAPLSDDNEGGEMTALAMVAVESVAEQLCELASTASSLRLPGPPGGWKLWKDRVVKLVEGQVDESWEFKELDVNKRGNDRVMHYLQCCLLDMEGRLAKATGDLKQFGTEEEENEEMPEEQAEEEAQPDNGDDDSGEEGNVDNAELDVDMTDADGEAPKSGMEVDQNNAVDGEDDMTTGAADKEQHEDDLDREARMKRRLSHGHPRQLLHTLLVSEDDAPEEVESDDEGEMTVKEKKKFLWRNVKERLSWQVCVKKALTSSRLAYCMAVLTHLSAQPLLTLRSGRKKK